MGFWDTAGKLASTAAKLALNSMQESVERHNQLREEMGKKSSEELQRIISSEGFFSSSKEDKAHARLELKRRSEL